MATSHLVGAGCKRLIFVGRHRSAPSCVARGVGFRDALHDAGIECRAEFIQHQTDPSSEEEVRRIMADLRPDGIVCSNDFTAAQLMKTLEQLSVSIPDDVKMVGFDDVKYASLLSVPLTTIHQPCAEIGAAAIRTMVERVHESEAALAGHSAELRPRCPGVFRIVEKPIPQGRTLDGRGRINAASLHSSLVAQSSQAVETCSPTFRSGVVRRAGAVSRRSPDDLSSLNETVDVPHRAYHLHRTGQRRGGLIRHRDLVAPIEAAPV